MRIALAEKLLVKIMEWTPAEVQKERPMLQALASFKYDEYQQYSPGMRFIESLVRWLKQFKTKSEKVIAYNFIKSKLIFISGEQFLHLVSLGFSLCVRPALLERTAKELGISRHYVHHIANTDEYKKNLRRTLFLGLSDGSRIDQFRRSANINNEQVLPTYEISQAKAVEMMSELEKSTGFTQFNSVFLVDDFTASGRSYFSVGEGGPKGKVYKFLSRVLGEEQKQYSDLICKDDLTINLLFYVATKDALGNIREQVANWAGSIGPSLKFEINAIQIINENAKDEIDFIQLCSSDEYFDGNIVDEHYEKGKHEFPYLGFNECALPLVLNHNTPNNSLPILWLPEDKKFKGLFPRVTRHRE